MQNTVYQNKRSGLKYCNLHLVTYQDSGNCPANGLVTKAVLFCAILHKFEKQQINEIYFIISRLRPIFTVLFLLVFLESFHTARHTFATLMLTEGISVESVSKMLGHTDIKTTQIYARILNEKVIREVSQKESGIDSLSADWAE